MFDLIQRIVRCKGRKEKYWILKLFPFFFRRNPISFEVGKNTRRIKQKSIQQQITHLGAEGDAETFFHMFFVLLLLSAFSSLMSFDIIKTRVKGGIQMCRDQSFVVRICNCEAKLEFLEEEGLFFHSWQMPEPGIVNFLFLKKN